MKDETTSVSTSEDTAITAFTLGTVKVNRYVGKKKYADVEPEIIKLMEKAQDIRVKLLKCIDDDAVAFEPLTSKRTCFAGVIQLSDMCARMPPSKFISK